MPQVTIDFTDEEWNCTKAQVAQPADDTDAKKDARVAAWITANAKVHAQQCVDAQKAKTLKAAGLPPALLALPQDEQDYLVTKRATEKAEAEAAKAAAAVEA